jgi:phosphatidyl-myo-inositol dimannoside synthase
LRVLYVSHSFPVPGRPLSNIGGMQRAAVDLERALAAHPAFDLTTICLETSWRWTALRTPPFLLSLLSRIPRLVRERGIDVVLFSSMVTASIAPLIEARVRSAGAILAAIPVGRDVTLPNPLYQRLVPQVLRALDVVLPISRATAAECLARGAPTDRVRVVPCGVGFPASQVGKASARRTVLELVRAGGHRIPDDALLLLSVGRHQERKGFHWFVEQVVPLLEARVFYLLAGSGPATPLVRGAMDRAGAGDRTVLLGQVGAEILATLYRGSDLFVMPNVPIAGDIEGFGIVMIEAGAAGLPVLAADLDGIRDVITPGENGRLVPGRDAPAFARAVQSYGEPGVAEREGRAAARYVRARFSLSAIAEEYARALNAFSASPPEEPGAAAQHRQPAAEHLRREPEDCPS